MMSRSDHVHASTARAGWCGFHGFRILRFKVCTFLHLRAVLQIPHSCRRHHRWVGVRSRNSGCGNCLRCSCDGGGGSRGLLPRQLQAGALVQRVLAHALQGAGPAPRLLLAAEHLRAAPLTLADGSYIGPLLRNSIYPSPDPKPYKMPRSTPAISRPNPVSCRARASR